MNALKNIPKIDKKPSLIGNIQVSRGMLLAQQKKQQKEEQEKKQQMKSFGFRKVIILTFFLVFKA